MKAWKHETLDLLYKGKSVRKIAKACDISINTAYSRVRILKKLLNLKNKSDFKNIDKDEAIKLIDEHESIKSYDGLPSFTPRDSLYILTPKERAITILLLQNYKAMDIAKEVNIEIGTVKFHLGRIYKKLKVKNKVELLIKYMSGQIKVDKFYNIKPPRFYSEHT